MYQNKNLQPNLAFAPKSWGVRSVDQPKSGSRYGQKRRATNCPSFDRGNGFLTHAFLPLVNGYGKEIKASKRVAENIFSAAQNLCHLYGIKQEEYSHLIYPQNIASLVEDLQQQMVLIDKEINILVVTQESNIPTLTTSKTFNTKTTLYYLAIEPLCFLMQQAHKVNTANCSFQFSVIFIRLAEFLFSLKTAVISITSIRRSMIGIQKMSLLKIRQSMSKFYNTSAS